MFSQKKIKWQETRIMPNKQLRNVKRHIFFRVPEKKIRIPDRKELLPTDLGHLGRHGPGGAAQAGALGTNKRRDVTILASEIQVVEGTKGITKHLKCKMLRMIAL